MPWRARLPLAEALQLLEREVVAGEVERRVLEDAGVAGGEDEPVAVRPVRVGRVVPHHVAVEDVGERRERHRGPRMARVRLLHAVHRQRPDRVDRQLLGVVRHVNSSHQAVGTALTRNDMPPPVPARDHVRRARGRRLVEPHYPTSVAVLIASSLRKEFSGDPLFDGVSFKLERRERLALSGPNGAGKTTLLRALVRETELQGGELAFAKDTRVALHDQRPPRESGVTLREYALSGAADLVGARGRAAAARAARWPTASTAPATMRRYGEAQARLEHAGGYRWRDRADAALHGLGFTDDDLDRGLETFSGGELTRASLARALAGDPDLLLLDEPTNHLDMASIEWLERELALDRRRRRARRARPLVPRGGGDRRARARRRRARRSSPAAGTSGARRRPHERSTRRRSPERQAEEIARLERFVARFRYGTKSRQAQSKLKQTGARRGCARRGADGWRGARSASSS